jgi:hypothetical protein
MNADDLLDHLEEKYGPDPELRGWLRPVVQRILRLDARSEETDDLLMLVVDVYSRDVRVRHKLRLARQAVTGLSRRPLAVSPHPRPLEPPSEG